MSSKLEEYLEKIDQYLALKEDKHEVLNEIKEHILTKAESEFGNTSEESVSGIIDGYGSPQEVAGRYLEDIQIISPTYKKHLFRYTLGLFLIHMGITMIALLLGRRMLIFPFFFIPRMSASEVLAYIPVSFFYDLGLVGFFLFLVTQQRKEIHLPWIGLGKKKIDHREWKVSPPRIWIMALIVIGWAALIAIYEHTGTLFFVNLDLSDPQSLLNPAASRWYSLAFLTLAGFEAAAYGMRFLIRSPWIMVGKNGLALAVLALILNNPIEDAFVPFDYFDIPTAAGILIVIVLLAFTWSFFRSLYYALQGLFRRG